MHICVNIRIMNEYAGYKSFFVGFGSVLTLLSL